VDYENRTADRAVAAMFHREKSMKICGNL